MEDDDVLMSIVHDGNRDDTDTDIDEDDAVIWILHDLDRPDGPDGVYKITYPREIVRNIITYLESLLH
jgi:hypothetical protein